MFKQDRRKPNCRRRALLGLLITASLGVQCQQMTRRGAPSTEPISVERLYTAALVTDTTDELEMLAKSDPLAFLDRCRDNYFASFRDYVCTFTKQERIGRRVTPEQETLVKYREMPFSVNMRWVRNADAAAHVTYIEGRWPDKNGRDQAWCEPAGAIARLFIKKILQPIHGRSASKASRRTIDEFGFRSTLDLIIKYARKADDAGILDLRYVGPGSVDGRSTFVFERRSPYTGPDEPYPERLLVFHIDREWLVPTACYAYGDDLRDDLLGRYVLTDVSFNNHLDDRDFGPESLGL